jgi:hypothetical protein
MFTGLSRASLSVPVATIGLENPDHWRSDKVVESDVTDGDRLNDPALSLRFRVDHSRQHYNA